MSGYICCYHYVSNPSLKSTIKACVSVCCDNGGATLLTTTYYLAYTCVCQQLTNNSIARCRCHVVTWQIAKSFEVYKPIT